MDDYIHDLLIRGIASIKAGEKESGRKALERLLDLDTSQEDRVEACWYLSQAAEDKQKARGYLEDILANDPTHARARRELAILDGRLKADEVIDPDRFALTPGATVEGEADRFICPKCGGKMAYSPDGRDIICEFCANRERQKQESSADAEQDFFLAMATKKGQSRQMDTITFDCEGCGSQFILPPSLLTIHCPYCGSSYVVRCSDPKSVLEPNRVIPFEISEERVKEILRGWFRMHTPKQPFQVLSGMGVYLPVWVFSIEGPVPYHYEIEREKNKKEIVNAEDFMLESGICIAASGNPQNGWEKEIQNYDLDSAKSYDPAYLSNWVAESYRVSVADASLPARQIALEREKQKLWVSLEGGATNLQVLSSKISVVGFELILLPVWLISYRSQGKGYHAFVNGVNGKVRDERYEKQNLGQKLFDYLRQGRAKEA